MFGDFLNKVKDKTKGLVGEVNSELNSIFNSFKDDVDLIKSKKKK
jgi:hypothetical protein